MILSKNNEGFALILVIVAIAIIALVYFGTMNRQGEADRALEAKKQAEKTVGEVEERLNDINSRINQIATSTD